eukprot:TRINITY_DN69152_c0_g1_i1.p2 TRINITY_DN69152_c0_g1~~TRINITY_DN69152_c0_g1_i1.p2  ORF type:complete len:189 (+),score=37.84 TRINITY_DN69152_c0_g1_i1:62-628(+)
MEERKAEVNSLSAATEELRQLLQRLGQLPAGDLVLTISWNGHNAPMPPATFKVHLETMFGVTCSLVRNVGHGRHGCCILVGDRDAAVQLFTTFRDGANPTNTHTADIAALHAQMNNGPLGGGAAGAVHLQWTKKELQVQVGQWVAAQNLAARAAVTLGACPLWVGLTHTNGGNPDWNEDITAWVTNNF